MSGAPPLRYAIIFRTHFWDAFAERQYQRLKARVRSGDVFILANETAAKLPIPHPNVVSHDEKTILDLGLCGDGYKSMLWFNSDYPLYYFHERYPDYDYYVVCEY